MFFVEIGLAQPDTDKNNPCYQGQVSDLTR